MYAWGANMENIKCAVENLFAGMKVTEDVYSKDNQLLVPSETVLTTRMITRLRFYQIKYVSVSSKSMKNTTEMSYYQRIERTMEFKKFDHFLKGSVQNLTKSFHQVITSKEEINLDELLKSIDAIMKETRNGIHLIQMLQCIRSYDDLTYVHCVNVALICNVFGTWLNFSQDEVQTLTLCGMLHDIGKVVIPDEIVKKPGKLTTEEYRIMQTHAQKGYEILQNKNIDERIKNAALLHHERCDGKGYPIGLSSSQIDDFAKIVAIADVYDAMTANRVYRQAVCPFEVIEIFEQDGYQKYDPKFLLPFLEQISQSYIHNNVRLSNDKEGEVVLINRFRLSKPVIKVEDEYIDLSKNHQISIKNVL